MSEDAHPDSDAALAHATLAGDQRAFATLMQRHRDAVFRLLRAQTGNADTALDLTQDCFIAAYSALAHYDRERPFRAWVMRIALNKCRDWARRRAVRRFFTFAAPLDDAMPVADDAASPEQATSDRLEAARVMQAIATLPNTLKEPLTLYAIEGMSQSEVAVLLGISEKAVETRIYRARTKLTEYLNR